MKKSRNLLRKKKHFKIRKKISGTNECPRITIYKSNTAIYAQAIDDQNHKTLAFTSTKNLKIGKNIEDAKKMAQDLAKKINSQKIKKVVFDRSGYIYHGKVKAIADTLRESGLKF